MMAKAKRAKRAKHGRMAELMDRDGTAGTVSCGGTWGLCAGCLLAAEWIRRIDEKRRAERSQEGE